MTDDFRGARVRPFRALVFDPSVAGDMQTLVAPPYDVIGPEYRDELASRNPWNVVGIDLPSILYDTVAATATEAFREWRTWPAPRRGEVVRQLGVELRRHKEALGRLVTLEMGKILSEGLGEVQEMIEALKSPPCDIIAVANELGMGIVPENRMVRRFRDLAGLVNQQVAALADEVILMVSGIPFKIKEQN